MGYADSAPGWLRGTVWTAEIGTIAGLSVHDSQAQLTTSEDETSLVITFPGAGRQTSSATFVTGLPEELTFVAVEADDFCQAGDYAWYRTPPANDQTTIEEMIASGTITFEAVTDLCPIRQAVLERRWTRGTP
jgi:hypothetical protein